MSLVRRSMVGMPEMPPHQRLSDRIVIESGIGAVVPAA
ncbi:hypothetical protein MMEU_5473 [Mycobacterium marinum str. Europe]|nr:hypothetical protein MMEU_5473 [Mycobacterium marinum str. Europe]